MSSTWLLIIYKYEVVGANNNTEMCILFYHGFYIQSTNISADMEIYNSPNDMRKTLSRYDYLFQISKESFFKPEDILF